jgi:geranylgeranyl pyrophosphate synthase
LARSRSLKAHYLVWQELPSRLLTTQLETDLATLSGRPDLYRIAKEPLTKARRGLADYSSDNQPWPLLPMIVCEAVFGRYEPALPAAAAIQLMMAAGDVFDDIEDADSSESLVAKYGTAVAVNAATALIVLAEKAICRLVETGLDSSLVVRAIDVFNSFYTAACIGQHADLVSSQDLDISEDDYALIAGQKSASQIECACHLGALLAASNEELVRIFSSFGHSLGMASQIANDIQGIVHRSDIRKPKITLPLIFALNNSDVNSREQIKAAFTLRQEAQFDPEQFYDLLFQSGGVHYALLKMEYYKQEALNFLQQAEKSGLGVERLKPFLA